MDPTAATLTSPVFKVVECWEHPTIYRSNTGEAFSHVSLFMFETNEGW